MRVIATAVLCLWAGSLTLTAEDAQKSAWQGQLAGPKSETRYETRVEGLCSHDKYAMAEWAKEHPPTPGCAACEACGIRCAACEAKAISAPPAPPAPISAPASAVQPAPAPGDGAQAAQPAQPAPAGECEACKQAGMICPDCAAKKAKAEGKCPVCAAKAAEKAIWESEEARLRAEWQKKQAERAALPQAWLGVELSESRGHRVWVQDAVAGGPAAAAGIQKGDQLLLWGNLGVMDTGDVQGWLAGSKAGDKVIITVLRDQAWVTANVTLGTAPAAGAAQPPAQPEPPKEPEKPNDGQEPPPPVPDEPK